MGYFQNRKVVKTYEKEIVIYFNYSGFRNDVFG